jgi:RNA polymerase sigma-70 factor (ECF subfamily)
MGTMTMTVVPFELAPAGWVRKPRQPNRRTTPPLPAPSPLQQETKQTDANLPFVRLDLPVQRDGRGTLLPKYQEGSLLQPADEPSGEEPWRSAAPAVPAVDATKVAETLALHQVVFACMRGDSAAWQQLVLTQHRRVYGICYRFTGSPTDAEDLTQDVFLKVYRNLQGFDPEKGAFTTWLTTLTRNLLVDHCRRTRQDRATDSLDEPARGDESEGPTMADRLADTRPGQMHRVAQMEMRSRIQHALKQLSPELREAVILRDLQDMDYKEIAAVLHVPEGTVKSRISRGRAELARMLGRTEGQVM